MQRTRLPARLSHVKRFIPRPPVKPAEWVYLVGCHDFIKIGIAGAVADRLVGLQVGCPYDLTVVACWRSPNPIQEEEALHEHLGRYRIRGEWFKLPKPLMDRITRKIAGADVAEILREWPVTG